MQVIETIAAIKEARRRLAAPVGLVPTMGYLHQGHLNLVKEARTHNAAVVVSIFVNPTQFGPQEDLSQYPRSVPCDLTQLKNERTDIVFLPPVAEMYPPGFNSWVDVEGVTEFLEGAARPSHFRGVATVVNKLFNIIQPDSAYFGQKDAQQVVVIKKMVTDLNMNLEIVTVATTREPDGLAMSSRNVYLSPDERRAAPVLFRSLQRARQLYLEGNRDGASMLREMTALLGHEPLATVDYISIANAVTLEEMTAVAAPALVSLAVRFGKTRLIDNIILE
jgi:pantoate--beta-alanine ligase